MGNGLPLDTTRARSLAAQLVTHRTKLAGLETSKADAERVLTMESHAPLTYAQASALIAHCNAGIVGLQNNITHLTKSLTDMGIDPDIDKGN